MSRIALLFLAFLLSGCGLTMPWETTAATDQAVFDLVDTIHERESNVQPAPHPCSVIQYPGDRAAASYATGYYVAMAGCLTGNQVGSATSSPAAQSIIENWANVKREEGRNSIEKFRIFSNLGLGVLDTVVGAYSARQDRESAERIADRNAETPLPGSISVGGDYTVNTDSQNDDSTSTASTTTTTTTTTTTDSHDDSSTTTTDSHDDSSTTTTDSHDDSSTTTTSTTTTTNPEPDPGIDEDRQNEQNQSRQSAADEFIRYRRDRIAAYQQLLRVCEKNECSENYKEVVKNKIARQRIAIKWYKPGGCYWTEPHNPTWSGATGC